MKELTGEQLSQLTKNQLIELFKSYPQQFIHYLNVNQVAQNKTTAMIQQFTNLFNHGELMELNDYSLNITNAIQLTSISAPSFIYSMNYLNNKFSKLNHWILRGLRYTHIQYYSNNELFKNLSNLQYDSLSCNIYKSMSSFQFQYLNSNYLKIATPSKIGSQFGIVNCFNQVQVNSIILCTTDQWIAIVKSNYVSNLNCQQFLVLDEFKIDNLKQFSNETYHSLILKCGQPFVDQSTIPPPTPFTSDLPLYSGGSSNSIINFNFNNNLIFTIIIITIIVIIIITIIIITII
jgi:hypothetical protein